MISFLIYWWQEIVNFFLLTISLTIFFYKQLFLYKKFIAIGVFLLIILIIEIFATVLTSKGINNLFLYYLLTPLQLLILIHHFALILNPHFKKPLIYIIGLSGLILMGYFSISESLKSYPSNSILIRNLTFCVLSLLYFKTLLSSEDIIDIKREPMFWFVTGLLIFSFSSVVIDGSMKLLIRRNENLANQIFLVWLCLNYIFYGFIIGAFSLEKKWKT